jgi:hypothetical protein
VLSDHLAELRPIVYDPTVGDAIEQYSHEYRRPRGIFLSIDAPDDIAKAFGTLGLGPGDVDLIVCSDAEEIHTAVIAGGGSGNGPILHGVTNSVAAERSQGDRSITYDLNLVAELSWGARRSSGCDAAVHACARRAKGGRFCTRIS